MDLFDCFERVVKDSIRFERDADKSISTRNKEQDKTRKSMINRFFTIHCASSFSTDKKRTTKFFVLLLLLSNAVEKIKQTIDLSFINDQTPEKEEEEEENHLVNVWVFSRLDDKSKWNRTSHLYVRRWTTRSSRSICSGRMDFIDRCSFWCFGQRFFNCYS